MCALEKEFSNIDIHINVKKRRFFWGGDFETKREIKENAKENADATSLSLLYIYICNIYLPIVQPFRQRVTHSSTVLVLQWFRNTIFSHY